MKTGKPVKIGIFILLLFLLFIIIIPNVLNSRERMAFSEDSRLENAKRDYSQETLGDSATIVPGPFYKRGPAYESFLGPKYRRIWSIPVTVPVLKLDEYMGGLDTVKFSGSQQTIGIDVKDSQGREWAVRSVNKDQSKALPALLRPTFLRFLFRDQAAALNPYGALVVPVLAEAIELHHTNPKLFIFPYNERFGNYNKRMAGRLVLMEEDADASWTHTPEFKGASLLMDTDDMLDTAKAARIPVDTILFARSRLFDLLINDWDRHEGNWEWALMNEDGKQWIEPVPVDRDMVFYQFNDGLASRLTLFFNNKFQSFGPEYEDIEGLMHQSKELDRSILRKITRHELQRQVKYIQEQLTEEKIKEAFLQYPPPVYQEIGRKHETILKSRLSKLPQAADRFHKLLQNE